MPAAARCPPRPRGLDRASLGFERRPAVRWFHPLELVRSGIRVVLGETFGSYADKREVQAALHPTVTHPEFNYATDGHLDDAGNFWFDYVADLADGFDATYTIARLLAEPTLTLGGTLTRRGHLLVMGGDEVYPTATRREYEDRMVGPYRAALPCEHPDQAPHLFAIPGNHDWYDGLTSFLRLFAQRRWVGGWNTQQTRSYFAMELPHRHWLWGIDIQLSADIDQPQREYFEAAAQRLQPGDKVIVCTAEPSWVKAAEGHPEGYQNLAFLQERLIRPRGAEAVLILTGDSHHYCRYRRSDGAQTLITAGGGGAFLHGTNTLPDAITLEREPWHPGGKSERLLREKTFPSSGESKRASARIWRFPILNWSFALLLAAFWLTVSWQLESASRAAPILMLEALAGMPLSPTGIVRAVATSLAYSPGGAAMLTLFVGGCIGFCKARNGGVRVLLGLVHALAHIGAWLGLLWLFAHVNLNHLRLHCGSGKHAILSIAEALIPGGLVHGFVFGAYLAIVSRWLPEHVDDIFSALSIPDMKNFLRLRIDKAGVLTVYPVGVRTVPDDFELSPATSGAAPWFESKKHGAKIVDLAQLIEPPVVIEPPGR